MTFLEVNEVLGNLELALCIGALCAILWSRSLQQYGYLAALLGGKVLFVAAQWGVLNRREYLHLNARIAYQYDFYIYWTGFAVTSILMLVVICSMYRLAMAPLKGLHTLGMLVFKWVAAISVLVALGSAFAPHITTVSYIVAFVAQMQRTQSILILCLLLFVCFAIRPMGLSYRSRIFGVSLGLGVMATTDMVQSAWVHSVNSDMYGIFSIIGTGAVCLTFATWAVYFALPEPKRRLITLPTTSPFLRWNQISEILGDSPGHVAIGGLPPEMLAPAEIEVMRRASMKMKLSLAGKAQSADAA